MLDIKITKTTAPRAKPTGALGFGKCFTDHMFLMEYTEGKGWHSPRIEPYHDLTLSPAAMVFHYGQEMFEGLKAYRNEQGASFLFRPEKNAQRTNVTNERLCIPQIPEDDYVQAVHALVQLEQDWIPRESGCSLYIRPFVIATEPYLGVDISKSFLFCIILSPSGAYYESGLAPVGIWIEDEYVRAVPGGMGFAKAGGNYAVGLAAQVKAHKEGYAQVLWLDGVHRRFIEEVGAMNIFFKIADKVLTPALNGSILPGITRDAVLTLCKSWGLPVEERKISVEELLAAQADGTLEEVFGTGTAAVISPVGRLRYRNDVLEIGGGQIGALSQRLYDTITGIQWGRLDDPFGWRVSV